MRPHHLIQPFARKWQWLPGQHVLCRAGVLLPFAYAKDKARKTSPPMIAYLHALPSFFPSGRLRVIRSLSSKAVRGEAHADYRTGKNIPKSLRHFFISFISAHIGNSLPKFPPPVRDSGGGSFAVTTVETLLPPPQDNRFLLPSCVSPGRRRRLLRTAKRTHPRIANLFITPDT